MDGMVHEPWRVAEERGRDLRRHVLEGSHQEDDHAPLVAGVVIVVHYIDALIATGSNLLTKKNTYVWTSFSIQAFTS